MRLPNDTPECGKYNSKVCFQIRTLQQLQIPQPISKHPRFDDFKTWSTLARLQNLKPQIWPKVSTQLNFWEKHDTSQNWVKPDEVKARSLEIQNPVFKSKFEFYSSCLARSKVWHSSGLRSCCSRLIGQWSILVDSPVSSLRFHQICLPLATSTSSVAIMTNEMVVSLNTSYLGRYTLKTLNIHVMTSSILTTLIGCMTPK